MTSPTAAALNPLQQRGVRLHGEPARLASQPLHRKHINEPAVSGWILHIRQFIDRLFDVCSGNVLVLGIIGDVLHCVWCWKVFEYCRCVVIRHLLRV